MAVARRFTVVKSGETRLVRAATPTGLSGAPGVSTKVGVLGGCVKQDRFADDVSQYGIRFIQEPPVGLAGFVGFDRGVLRVLCVDTKTRPAHILFGSG